MYFYQLVYYPALFLFVVFLYRWLKKQERRSFLDFYIQNRRDERSLQFKNISKYCSTLDSQKAKEITSWSYKEVKENLQKGRVTCEDVLKAFQQKAIEVDEKTNCVCLFIEEALDLARDLDKQAEDKNYVKPPLFGVPVSIKESIHVKGMDSTSGYVQDLNKPSEDDATVVKQLKKLGAVPFVHTNIPLSLCTYGCTNAIYGATGNPLDVNRVPGGSSGGEAALIALGGSVLGIGSDVGGSIRTPATFCGISGFKPSNLRVSHLGNPGGVPGRQMIIATEGPMAPHIDTCVDYLKLAWGDDFLSDFDPYVAPVKWQNDLYTSDKQLTIGFYTDDKFLKAAPANERVVRECASKLRALGHRVVPFEVPDGFRAFELMAVAVSADGGKFLNDKMGKDLVLPDSDFGFVARSPIAFQRLLSKILPWPRICRLLKLLPRNCEDQRKNIADIQAYRHTFITKMKEQNIDVLICLPMSIYPPEHLVPAQLLPATNYTSLYNLLDFGAGTVPITKVTKEDDEALKDYPENDPFDKKIKQQCQGMIGYPVGIQVAAPPFREEIALRVLKQLEDAYY